MRSNAFLTLKLFRRLHRKMQRQTVPDHRNIAAFAQQIRFTNRHRVVTLWDLFLDQLVAFLVLEEQHRIRVAHGRFQQTFGIIRRIRSHNLQPGRTKENRFRALRMVQSAEDTAADRRADY
ncbi:hypothetical protein D3C81_2017820 [compost metagenome]